MTTSSRSRSLVLTPVSIYFSNGEVIGFSLLLSPDRFCSFNGKAIMHRLGRIGATIPEFFGGYIVCVSVGRTPFDPWGE
jgi:hypothetical protein